MQNERYKDCYARLGKNTLTVGNDLFERVWSWENGVLETISLYSKQPGKEWIAPAPAAEWLDLPEKFPVFFLEGATEGPVQVTGMEAVPDDDFGVGETCLQVTVSIAYAGCRGQWQHRIYSGLPGVSSRLNLVATGEKVDIPERPEEWPRDYLDSCTLAPEHLQWHSVAFADQTDDRENLVAERTGILSRRESLAIPGNLLFVQDVLDEEGLLFIKEGPTPQGRLSGAPTEDFLLKGLQLYMLGFGFSAEELKNEALSGYGNTVLLWNKSNEQALRALHRYHRARRTFRPERDAYIMANTWGDGNADGRISEEFLMSELHRAKELGITCYQIDDGWQNGTTANSVNAAVQDGGTWGEGYYKSNPNFWSVNQERLPHGLEPIVAYAKENGITLGLWFSPDSIRDFENWERDSEVLLSLHRKYGISAFKMDGLIFRSKLGEENFVRLMQRVVTESGGKVYFNLDTTAGVRNGYFGRVQYGTLFVENRFTNAFGHWPNYWPYRTLRNLWSLCRYIPADRLQMEFLNTARNTQLYGDDPLAPSACGQAYAFAATLCSSPLAWMELSALSEQSADTLRNLLAKYKPVQSDLLAGQILPIGEEPNGASWTGFQSLTATGGYLLIIRENSTEASHGYRLWGGLKKALILKPVLGDGEPGTVAPDATGKYNFVLPRQHSFVLYSYRAEE